MFVVEAFNSGKWEKVHRPFVTRDMAQRHADGIDYSGGIARVVDERPAGAHQVKGFYVSFRDGCKTALAFGPFPSHREALDAVKAVADRLYELKPESHFWSRGTASQQADDWGLLPVGKLNGDPSLSHISLARN
ncbi:hypothetical protein GJ654_10285 [Rhodoblastus acidophilus]|uniref:Uncharacterized protein n=1 Tax=Rhodoblastus acidophilus TaxID=1074 RepID=A0A6N8DQC2_RHOAC|nr:hypothetical protein [Rhodoblastus acidophilus]MCW2275112.1 hypothetical protein [Rhodoblastus acidophilus]MTV31381.1 hypothetical protein [Rhodoblastus acidophilus]